MSYKLTEEQCKEAVERAVRALFEYCKANGIHYIVTGSSGGLDSAVTLGLAQRTCQMAEENGYKLVSVGLVLPCYTKSEETERGKKAIQVFGAEEISYDFSVALNFLQEDIDEINHRVKDILRRTNGAEELKEWENSIKIAQGNIKARLRMTFGTYHVARMMKGMVLSTDNLSEYWMAFWTLHGDVGDYGMVQNVLKGLELYDVARYLGVPQEIIDAKPDDGLGIGNGDEDQLGASYPIIDKVIITLIQQGFNPDGSWSQLDNLPGVDDVSDEVVKKLAMRALQGAYKRKGTITLSRQELGLPSIKNIPIKKQVAIYGGSFNPPSKHHCRIVEELEKQFDLVIIYPCGNRPDKPSANIVSIEHRKEMMKLAFGGMPNTRLDLHDLENDTFTPTYDLQERIQGQFENAEIWHFVGSDLIVGGRDSNSEIQRVWHHGQILWQYFNFAINIRPGYEIAEDDMPPNSKLIEIKDLVGSGTMIRERIKNGAPIQDFVLPEVEGYIRKYGLYSKN